MVSSDPSSPSQSIAITDILSKIWSQRTDILFITLVAAGLGLAFALIMPPQYTSTSQVILENFETDFERSGPQYTPPPPIDEADVTTQVEVIKSYDIALRVMKTHRLLERGDFLPLPPDHSLFHRLMEALGVQDGRSQEESEILRKRKVLEAFFENLTVYAVPKSRAIFIEFRSHSPRLAAEIAQGVAEAFVTYTRELQSEQTGRARNWLSTQVDTLRDKVVRAEVSAEKFRAEAGLLKGETSTLSAQEISELNRQLTTARIERAQAESRKDSIQGFLKKNQTVDPSLALFDSPLMQKLREQKAALSQKLAEFSVVYLGRHPKIQTVQRELAAVDSQVRAEVQKILLRLSQEVEVADLKIASLSGQLGILKTKASSSNVADVTLRALEREAAANRSLLEVFLQKYSEASSKEPIANQPALARIVSKAQIPVDPSFPLKGPIVVLSGLAGFFMSVLIFFIIAIIRESARLERSYQAKWEV